MKHNLTERAIHRTIPVKVRDKTIEGNIKFYSTAALSINEKNKKGKKDERFCEGLLISLRYKGMNYMVSLKHDNVSDGNFIQPVFVKDKDHQKSIYGIKICSYVLDAFEAIFEHASTLVKNSLDESGLYVIEEEGRRFIIASDFANLRNVQVSHVSK